MKKNDSRPSVDVSAFCYLQCIVSVGRLKEGYIGYKINTCIFSAGQVGELTIADSPGTQLLE